MNLILLYHSWCRGHSSPMFSTFISIGHLLVEANFVMNTWKQKTSSFQQNLRRFDGHEGEYIKFRASSEGVFIYVFGWQDMCGSLAIDICTCTKLESIIHVGIWIFEFGVHLSFLEAVKVHWVDDGCLTNIFKYDQSLVCGNQLCYEDLGRNIFVWTHCEKIQQLQSWASEIMFLDSRVGWWDEPPLNKKYISILLA